MVTRSAARAWVLMVAMWGCASDAGAADSYTLFSSAGDVKLRLPAELKPHDDLNAEASIQAADPAQEMYLLVITEPKRDLPAGVTLEKYRDAALSNITKSTKGVTPGEPIELKIQGHAAIQSTFTATVPEIEPRIVYLLTTVESEQGFHQVLAWTLESLAEKNLPALKEVTASFQADLQPLSSVDGQLQLSLPPGMVGSARLHAEAELQAADPKTERYVIVLSEPKGDEAEPVSLAKAFEGDMAQLKSVAMEAKVGETEKLSVQGLPALRTTLTAQLEGIEPRVTYLVTLVESPRAFHKILCWTMADEFAKHEASLRLVADSLRVRAAPEEPQPE